MTDDTDKWTLAALMNLFITDYTTEGQKDLTLNYWIFYLFCCRYPKEPKCAYVTLVGVVICPKWDRLSV